MNHYHSIFIETDHFGSTFECEENVQIINIVRQLVTFSGDAISKLSLMNKRLRLFYFFKVHEIISLINEINDHELDNDHDVILTQKENQQFLMDQFYDILRQVGDLDAYKYLFISSINLLQIAGILNLARDLIKLVITYCHLRLDNADDLNSISHKIIIFNDYSHNQQEKEHQ